MNTSGNNKPVVLTAGGASKALPKFKDTDLLNGDSNTSARSHGLANGSSSSSNSPSNIGTEELLPISSNSSGNISNHSNSRRLNTNSTDDDYLSYDNENENSDDDSSFMDEEEGAEELALLRQSHIQITIDDLYDTSPNKGMGGNDNGGPSDGRDHDVEDQDVTKEGGKEEKSGMKGNQVFWLFVCFFGIMGSFVAYGLLLEYATSGGRKLHELSFLFVTSLLYTCTAAAGRHVRDEKPTTIPPARFAVLGITSMGSTFCSVRSLRYVIFPIQVLAKSCKPVPVMLMGALMGKKYPLKKYLNVCLIVAGVGLFMGGGDSAGKHSSGDSELSSSSQIVGLLLLFISLCFDGGTGAYEDKLMAVHSVGPFDLMYNIQLGKTIIAGVSLLVLNQVHVFLKMCEDMGFVLVLLGLTGAMGQVFIFVTISKFGALTCSIIGLARKVTTLVASIYIYGHHLNAVQTTGLVVCVGAMVMNFLGKSKKGGGHGGGNGHGGHGDTAAETSLPSKDASELQYRDHAAGPPRNVQVELPPANVVKPLTAGGRR